MKYLILLCSLSVLFVFQNCTKTNLGSETGAIPSPRYELKDMMSVDGTMDPKAKEEMEEHFACDDDDETEDEALEAEHPAGHSKVAAAGTPSSSPNNSGTGMAVTNSGPGMFNTPETKTVCTHPDGSKADKKVKVCHIPPGNLEARHTICVSSNALKAHIEHEASDGVEEIHDFLGDCSGNPTATTKAPTPTTAAPTPTTGAPTPTTKAPPVTPTTVPTPTTAPQF